MIESQERPRGDKMSEEDNWVGVLLRERLTRGLPLELKNAQIAEVTNRTA